MKDMYGFPVDECREGECRARQAEYVQTVLPRQKKVWDAIVGDDLEATVRGMRQSRKLKAAVRGGIPDALRPRVWACLAGASAKRSAMDAGYFERLVDRVNQREIEEQRLQRERMSAASAVSSAGEPRSELLEQLEQIDKDLGRTFPSHAFIATHAGQASLRRLLRAYCVGRNPRTGYCQGMNFLAALLLCVMERSEEAAFWLLLVMVERLLPSDYFTDGLTGVRVDSGILLDLMRERLPALHSHFERTGVLPMLPLVTTHWFISLFVFWLPSESLLRLWDCFFCDGLKSKNKVFFRASLAIFKLHERPLLEMTDVQMLTDGLRELSRATYDADQLVHELYNKQWIGHFSLHAVQRMEAVHRVDVMADMARRAERSARATQEDEERQSAAAAAISARPATPQTQPPLLPLPPPPTAPVSATSPGGGELAIDGAPETTVDEELVAARMARLSFAFAAHDDDDDDDDGDEKAAGEGAERGCEEEEEEATLGAPPLSSSVSPASASSTWSPRAYLLKRSPAKALSMMKKLAWQRRWFELSEETFCWYASAQAAAAGHEPLGRVPKSMILLAKPNGDASGFEVDVGNRVIHLALDGVPRVAREAHASSWCRALNSQEVLAAGTGAPSGMSHTAKFWKSPAKKP